MIVNMTVTELLGKREMMKNEGKVVCFGTYVDTIGEMVKLDEKDVVNELKAMRPDTVIEVEYRVIMGEHWCIMQ